MSGINRYKNLNRALLDDSVAEFAASLRAGATVLDVGAGSGHYRRSFPEQHYLALDRGYEQDSLAGLDVAADVYALPIRRAAVDAAICVEVIEHVPDTARFLHELAQVLRPGGRLLLTAPLCYGEHMAPHDFQRYTRYALERHFRTAGLTVIKLAPRGGFFTLLAYLMGRLPDEVVRNLRRRWLARLCKPLLRIVATYGLSPVLLRMDRLDRHKRFTLGYICLLQKDRNEVF